MDTCLCPEQSQETVRANLTVVHYVLPRLQNCRKLPQNCLLRFGLEPRNGSLQGIGLKLGAKKNRDTALTFGLDNSHEETIRLCN